VNDVRRWSASLPRFRAAIFDDPVGRTLLVAGLLVAGLAPTLRDGHLLDDMTAYTLAADRLLHGEQIYASYPGDLVPYKYAPWFAGLWVPLTFAPEPLLGPVWLGLSLASAGWLLWRAPWWLAIIAGPFVAWGAAIGNAAPLLFAVLAVALPTRAAAVVIGAIVSLKAFPILLLIPLVVDRRWREVVLAVAVAALLAAPMLLFDLSTYQVSSEGPHSINNIFGPIAWVVSAIAGLTFALMRPSWRTAGLAVILANPRFQWYDLGYLLIGRPREPSVRDAPQQPQATAET